MDTQIDFINANLSKLGYSSIPDIIENLYLRSVIESYSRIEKSSAIENIIRDRFVKDMKRNNDSLMKKWVQWNLIRIHWEVSTLTDEDDLGRMDITFETTGFDFILECKRLSSASKKYFDEGVMRFVNLKYAKPEEYAGMLGFVVSGNQKRILGSLHKMSANYNLTPTQFSSTPLTLWSHGFKGSHRRIDNTLVNIYHLLFDFSTSSS